MRTEVMAGNLAPEAKEIEIWRRRYARQAMVVIMVAAGLVIGAFFLGTPLELWLLLGLAVMIVAALMIDELQQALQVQAENLILAKRVEWGEKMAFDDGQGLDETLLHQMIHKEGSLTRECRAIMKGAGFVLEEDWFYDTISKKALAFHKTEFEGVILALSVKEAACQGRFFYQKGQLVAEGNIGSRFMRPVFRAVLKQAAALVQSKEMMLFVKEGQSYIWFKTNRRLFYQFKLWSANSPSLFIKRVHRLAEVAQALDKAISD